MHERLDPAAVLGVTSVATLLVLFAFTVPLTTLGATAAALGAGPQGKAWILSAMSVGAAAGLLGSGAIGDDYGRRRTFVIGAALLAAASLLAALASTTPLLVLARILQGLGGAAVISCSLGLIGHTFPAGAARTRATGIWAAALGAGVAVGPILSAWLEQLGNWRWPYALTALGAAALAAAGQARLPESRAPRPRRIDWAGTLLLGLGITTLLAALVQGRQGWGQPIIAGLLIAGLALLLAFFVVERLLAEPMLDLGLFRRPDFVAATVAAFAAGAGVLSLMTLVPTLSERVLGVGTVPSAVLLMAWSATSVLTAYGARWLPASLTPRSRLILGLLGVAAGQIALSGITSHSSVLRLLPGLLLAGIANGVLNAALGYQAVASVPAERAAMGSGANNTARYLGSAIGIAIVTFLIAHGGEAGGIEGLASGWNIAVLITTAFSLLGALIVFLAREYPAPAAQASSACPSSS